MYNLVLESNQIRELVNSEFEFCKAHIEQIVVAFDQPQVIPKDPPTVKFVAVARVGFLYYIKHVMS